VNSVSISRSIGALLATALATGCVSHDDASSGSIRLLNAVPDGPRVNLLINDTDAFVRVDYAVGTPFAVRGAGRYDIEVEQIMPAGDAVVVDLPDTPLAVGEELSLLLIGEVAEGTVTAWQLTSTTRGVTTGRTRLRVAHAAPDAPRMDVYLTDIDTVLASVTPFGTLRYQQRSPQAEFKSGGARLRLTPPGDPATVLFDSGAIILPLERDLLIVLLANVGPGTAPVQLVVLNNTGGGSTIVTDQDSPADLRVVNASPDSYPVDVTIDDGTDDGVTTVASALAFPLVAPGPAAYTQVDALTYTFKVIKSGDSTVVPLQFTASLTPGSTQAVILSDLIARLGRITLLEDPRRVATEARVRLVHSSPAAGAVDIYITAPGADLDDETPDFVNVTFGANTGYLPQAAGSYDVTFTVAGSKTDVRLMLPATVANGGIYTAILRDKAGGGLPAEAILLDDFTAP
jgi:hypothetical protein